MKCATAVTKVAKFPSGQYTTEGLVPYEESLLLPDVLLPLVPSWDNEAAALVAFRNFVKFASNMLDATADKTSDENAYGVPRGPAYGAEDDVDDRF